MAALDREKVARFEAEIKESRAILAEITSEEVNDFLRDPMKIRAMKYTLIVLVEMICNCAGTSWPNGPTRWSRNTWKRS